MISGEMDNGLLNSGTRNTFHVRNAAVTACSQDSLFSSLSSNSCMEDEGTEWRKSANPKTTILLSLLYLALLTFFGSAVLLAEMYHHSEQSQNVHGFLTVLMITSSAWMLWFAWESSKNTKIKVYQDHQAGASWLKGGLCLFALATLVLDCLTLGYFHELHHCMSILITSFPIVQAVFTIIQVSLLCFYAKVCIQEKQHLNRFGLMHTLATNILMWMSVVLDESMKQLEEIYDTQHGNMNLVQSTGIHRNSCVCITDLCHIFSEGSAYLHPFNIEFSLFSSTMLYVIWKNTGKISCAAALAGHNKGTLHINGAFVGLILGAFAISATFGVMISFGVLAKSPGTVPEALRIYYIFNSVLLSAMFIASILGIITCRLQKGSSTDDQSKSVVRSLDITLLMGSSCGPLMVSVFSLVAIFFLHIEGNLYVLDLCFSLCKTVQILGQNLFITEALYCGHARNKTAARKCVYSLSSDPANEMPQHGISNVSIECERQDSMLEFDGILHSSNIGSLVDLRKDAPKNLLAGSSITNISQQSQKLKMAEKPCYFRTRQKILQNISILLICYNISVWILYAYGTRPHLVSQIEQTFYGFTLWVIIVKISLPLGIFYRMHSVASLFEAYCNICEAAA